MGPDMELTILFGKLFATVFSVAAYPASLPIPVMNPNRMRINNVPPLTGSVLSSEASYTPFIPRYPVKSSTKEIAKDSRGPLESASFPRNGADPYTPTTGVHEIVAFHTQIPRRTISTQTYQILLCV